MFSLLRYVSKSGGSLRPHLLYLFRASLFAGLLSLLSGGLFAQNPRYVTPNGAGSRTGSSWSNALSGTGLQGALASAPAGTTFLIGGGLYKPTTTADRAVSFLVPSGVEVYGGYVAGTTNRATNPSSTTLSGDIDNDNLLTNNTYKVVQTSGTGVVLDGLVITQANNNANEGGFFGGGLLATSGASLTVRSVQFINNSAQEGGGMFVDRGSANLINCFFGQNFVRGSGAGLQFLNAVSSSVTSCIFSGNSASAFGGGLYINNSSPSVTNSSFLGNAAGRGGAISSLSSSPILINCSFSGNSAGSSTSGTIHIWGNGSSPVLTNCIIWGNSTSGVLIENGTSVTYRYTNSQDGVQPGPGNLSIDPLFANAAGGNLQLTSCSQLINAGDNSVSAGTTDQAGNPRRYNGGIIDIGAYEFQENSARLGITQQPASRTVVCAGTTVTATVSVTGSSATYQWYKDGVSLGASQRSAILTLPSVTTAETGNYLVGITNTCNSLTSSAFSLTVNPTPTPKLVSSGSLTCAQTSVTLTASGGTSYVFSGMGIVGQNATSGTAVVNAPGTYSVAVTGSNGCSSNTSVTVDRNINAPQLIINPSSATLTCTTPIVSLNASESGTYRWNTGSTTASISVSVAATYSVTLTGANGCSSTATAIVSDDKTPPLVSINPSIGTPTGATLTCATPILSLSAVGNGTYRWSTGATTSVISTTASGTYSVTLTGTNGCRASNSISVGEDRNPPSLTILPSSATLTCATPVLSLTAVGTGSYRWSTGATTSTISVSTADTYSVTLTVANGCSASSTTTPSQDFAPLSVSISPSNATLTCTIPIISLSTVGSGTYHWNTGATTASISVSVAATYSVTLTGPNGCSSTASAVITEDKTPPSINIEPASATLTCTTSSVSLSAVGNGTYRWSTGATTSSISVSVANTYSVTLTGANGCTATASTTVTYQNCAPTVANAIPPQSATLGNAFSYTIPANTFADAETPNSLTLSVAGLPAGLSFVSPNTITGTPSTTLGSPFTVTVVATDPDGLSVSTTFILTVNPRSFAITGVTMLDCNLISYYERRINFVVGFEATNGQPISLSVVNETRSITINEPYQLNLFTDNPVIIFKARQQGTPSESTFSYNWLAYCANGNPRVENPIPPQSVTVGQAFSYVIPANTFTDAETPTSLSLSALGLPAGLSLVAPRTITGTVSATASSFYSVTVIATDPAGGLVSTLLPLSVVNSTGCASMYSVQAGSWSDTSTWSCGRVPLLSDMVTINHAVSLPGSYQGQALRIIYTASGRLIFDSASRLRLGGN